MASALDINRAVNRAFSLMLSEYGVVPDVAAGFVATASFSSLPDQTGNTGKFLTTDGSAASWADSLTGVTVGTFSGTSTAKGLDITADVLTMHAADGTNPGAVSTSAQTFAGAKTFSNGILTNSVGASSASVLSMNGAPTDGASAVGTQIGSSTTLANATAKLVSIKNNSTEKTYFDLNGGLGGTSTQDVYGNMADGASAVAVKVRSNITYANTAAKLLSIQNNTTEYAFFDYGGNLHGGNNTFILGNSPVAGFTGMWLNSSGVGTPSSTNYLFYCPAGKTTLNTATGTTMSFGVANVEAMSLNASALTIAAGCTLASNVASGSKAISLLTGARVDFGGSSLAYLYGISTVNVASAGHFSVGNGDGATTGGVLYAYKIQASISNTGTPLTILGYVADGGAAVNIITDTAVAFSTAGAKLISVRNNNVEKAYFDKDGGLTVSGVASGSNAILLSAGQRLNFGSSYFFETSGAISASSSITSGGNFILGAGGIFYANTSNTANLTGQIANGASAVAVAFNNTVTLSTVGAKLVTFNNNGTEKLAVGKNGQFVAPTGNADSVVGTATLGGGTGTVTVSTTAVSASSKIFVSCATPAGVQGVLSAPPGSIVAATSFVINSSNAADTSTVNWWVIN
jgi:hypothetical protein